MSILYLGVFLIPESRKLLLETYPPLHPNIYGEHITVAFKLTQKEIDEFTIGELVTVEVMGHVSDSKGQAVLVHGVESKNAHPHITISTAEGVKPVYSNELFDKALPAVYGFKPIVLHGTKAARTRTDFHIREANGRKT